MTQISGKRSLFLFFCLLLCLLTACGPGGQAVSPTTPVQVEEKFEIALITTVNGLEDPTTQQVWMGIQEYAGESGRSSRYYIPGERDYSAAIREAIDCGAEIVLSPAVSQNQAICQAVGEHSKVSFLCINYELQDAAGQALIAENSLSLLFDQNQMGFLAGYAAVSDAYEKLGLFCMAGQEDCAYGFLQGASAAASALSREIEVHYANSAELEPGQSILSRVYPWYSDGSELVFICGRDALAPTVISAEASGTAIIALETEVEEDISDTIICQVKCAIPRLVAELLQAHAAGEFPNGSQTETIQSGGISLNMEEARFLTFGEDQYDALMQQIKEGAYLISPAPAGAWNPMEFQNPQVTILLGMD